MAFTQFDRLPVDILYTIFNYFYAHEIFIGFLNLNTHLNAVIRSYRNYRVNFQSILRSHFDLVCHYIRPDQISTLTLSDDNDTPGQSQLFLSYFQLDQCIQL